jgi:hypothetical protein
MNGVTHQADDGADVEFAEEVGAMGFEKSKSEIMKLTPDAP